jgi:hypothetical protein
LIITFCILLYGCSITSKPYIILDNDGETVTASFIQWNNDYAVTVKHIPKHPDYVYISGKYDIQFFEHSGIPVKWANLKENEKIVFTGYSSSEYSAIPSSDIGMAIKPKEYPIPVYRAGIATIMPGMSGGAVLNSKEEVIGMNIGFTTETIFFDNSYQKISIFVPYHIIKNEWENYIRLKND